MIVVERHVRASPAQVWDPLGRVGDWAELLPTVDRVEPLDDGAPAVGARYALTQPGLPRLVYRITAWVPGEQFTWAADAPGVRTTGTHTVRPGPEGAVLRLTLDWTGPLRPLVALVFDRRTRRYVEREAETFARLAEDAPRHGS